MEHFEPEPLVDARHVAKLLGTTPSYIARLALLGLIPSVELPSLKAGIRHRRRFRLSEVSTWIQSQAPKRAAR